MKNIWHAILINYLFCAPLMGMMQRSIPDNITKALEISNKNFTFLYKTYSEKDKCRESFNCPELQGFLTQILETLMVCNFPKGWVSFLLERAKISASEVLENQRKKPDQRLYTISLIVPNSESDPLPARLRNIKKTLCTICPIKKNGSEWDAKELSRVIDKVILETRKTGDYVSDFGTHHFLRGYEGLPYNMTKLRYLMTRQIEGISKNILNTCTRIEWCRHDDNRILCCLENPEYAHINNGKIELLLECYQKDDVDLWRTSSEKKELIELLAEKEYAEPPKTIGNIKK